MPFVHAQPDWPAFRWSLEAITSDLAATRYRQGKLLGRMEGLGVDLSREAALPILTDDVMKSSAIEGEALNPEEVRSSLARHLGLEVAGLPGASRQVEGVVEMTLDATQNYDAPLTEQRLFSWHAALFPTGRSGLRSITIGAWRTPDAGPMRVVSGAHGRQRVHFEAPDAGRVPAAMARFLDWFAEPPPVDPILKAAIAHLWFITIHPFEDGNGRIARAIADMALARADGTAQRCYSMSSQIAAERKQYYHQLELAQRGDLDITHWLSWFLRCLQLAFDRAELTLSGVLRKARFWQAIRAGRPVNERQRLVLNRLLDGFQGNLTTSRYAGLVKCSTDTALRDIHELVEGEILAQNPAGGRSTSYRLAEARADGPERRDAQ